MMMMAKKMISLSADKDFARKTHWTVFLGVMLLCLGIAPFAALALTEYRKDKNLMMPSRSDFAQKSHLEEAAPLLLEAVEAMLEEYEEGRKIQPFEIRELCRKAKYAAYGQSYGPSLENK